MRDMILFISMGTVSKDIYDSKEVAKKIHFKMYNDKILMTEKME